MKLAIIGATSHVAKNLTVRFAPADEMFLFAMGPGAVGAFFSAAGVRRTYVAVQSLECCTTFRERLDGVTNCIGLSAPERVRSAGLGMFQVTEHYDDIVLAYLQEHADAAYVNMSSGAESGSQLDGCVNRDSEFRLHLASSVLPMPTGYAI